MSCADDKGGLGAIERRLAGDDPALAEAFQRWRVPERAPDAQDGETTAPPWVLAVFVVAGISWVVSGGFGVLAAAIVLSWILLGVDRGSRDRRRSGPAADGRGADKPTGINGPDDGEMPPDLWRGRWI
jgi:hypothetical protein